MEKVFISKVGDKSNLKNRVLKALNWFGWENIVKPGAKVKGNLGTKESFPVLLILCLSVFSQVYRYPDDKAKDSFEETGNIGKIR